MNTTVPQPGDLRVVYSPQIPLPPYIRNVPDLATARIVLDTLTSFSLFEYENSVKPDYADLGGIERYEADGDGGHAWFDLDVDDEESEDAA